MKAGLFLFHLLLRTMIHKIFFLFIVLVIFKLPDSVIDGQDLVGFVLVAHGM